VEEDSQHPLVEFSVERGRRRISVIERVRLEHLQPRRSGQSRQIAEARQDVQEVGPDRRGMAGKHLAQHEVDDQERARLAERHEVVEAPRELALVARVIEHGADRRDDGERTLSGERGGVPRVEDVGAPKPRPESWMARGGCVEELGLDVGHQHVVPAIEGRRR